MKGFPRLVKVNVFHKAKSTVFSFYFRCEEAKNAFKELDSYSSLSSFLQTVIRNSLRNVFIYFVSPFKKKKNYWNRATPCIVFFLVFSFSCPSKNSSSDESTL